MPQTIRVGLFTNMGGAHLDAYFSSLARIEEVEAVVLADPSGRSVELAQKQLGKKLQGTFKDPGDLLQKARPQMALVSLPADQSPAAIDRALVANCHVLAEKPACTRAQDFAPLARKAEQNHRHLMLALANRLHAPVQEARRLIQKDQLGRLYSMQIHIVADQTRLRNPAQRQAWFCQRAQAGGGFFTWLGIHWLDLALYITGLRVQQVAGFKSVVGGQPIDVEDSVAASLQFPNNVLGTLTAGYYLDRGYQSHIQIWGEHGWLRLNSIEGTPMEWYSTRQARPQVQRFNYPADGRGYLPFVRAAVRASAGLQDAPISPAECLHVLQAIYAFYTAAESGRAQKV